ncbi:MAG TPA: EamA family transporter [Opitutaceae bacterium]|jgi:drug/metabolite transporter (DMT)-like permease
MTSLALALVLSAAGLHATWNFCAKRAGGGLPFVYLTALMINALYVPAIGIYLYFWRPHLAVPDLATMLWVVASGLLKSGYSLSLQRSYRTGDFSLVYPLSRGAAPLLSTVGAIVLLGERPSALALAGAAVIVAAIFFITDAGRLFHADRAHVRLALRQGLICGAFIATYTVWDRHGVSRLHIPPLLYDAGTAFTQLVVLTPFALRRWSEVAHHWQVHRLYAAGVAVLSPMAYILVLTAMVFTPVSYVAPAREVSIVIGAFIGARVLKEAEGRRRLLAAGAMAAGIIALALG